MPKTRIPSPARSQGTVLTPRRHKTRSTRSVGSPARSNASGRLTSFMKDKNMDSFALSPLPGRRSLLTDNTDIEEPRRRSWWKKLSEDSRDVIEVLEDNKITDAENVVEDYINIEVLSQEKKNYTLDLPESSDSESISSIVIPQRKLFTQKESQPQKKFGELLGNRESLAKIHKANAAQDKTMNAGIKNLFPSNKQRSKPIFPSALLNVSPDKTAADKTKEMHTEQPKNQVRNIFGNRPATKRKNMFAEFIMSDSEEEIPEIQPKIFGFEKKQDTKSRGSTVSRGRREPSPTFNSINDTEMDDWKLLPSSTMVDNQLESTITSTPVKRTKLSVLSEAKESEAGTNTNRTVDKTKQSNKSVSSKNKSKVSINNKSMDRDTSLRKKLKTDSNINKSRSSTTLARSQNNSLNKSQTRSSARIRSSLKHINQEEINEILIPTEEEHNNVNHEDDENNFTLQYENDEHDSILDDNITQKHANDTNKNISVKNKTVTTESNITHNKSKRLSENNISKNKSRHETVKTIKETEELKTTNEDEIISTEVQDTEENTSNAECDILENLHYHEEPSQKVTTDNMEIDENEIVGGIVIKASLQIQNHSKIKNIDHNEIINNQVAKNMEVDDEEVNEVEPGRINKTHNNSKQKEQDIVQNVYDDVPFNVPLIREQNRTHNSVTVNHDEIKSLNNATVSQEVRNESIIDSEKNQNMQNKSQGNVIQSLEKSNYSKEYDDNQEIQDDDEEVEGINEMSQEVQHDNIDNQDEEEVLDSNKASQEIQNDNENNVDDEEVQDNDVVSPGKQSDNEDKLADDEVHDKNPANQEIPSDNEDNPDESEVVQNNSEEIEESLDTQNDSQENADQTEEGHNNSKVGQCNDEDEVSQNIQSDIEHNLEEIEDIHNNSEEVEESHETQNSMQTNEDEEDTQNESDKIEEIQNGSRSKNVDEADNELDDEVEDDVQYESEAEMENESQEEQNGDIIERTETPNTNEAQLNSPEAILHDKTNQMHSYIAHDQNASLRKTKSMHKSLYIRPSIAPPRESTGIADGTGNSSAGSGWDSHRVTRKTIRQTFGNDFTSRKSLRALVMEKSAKRQTTNTEAHFDTVHLPQANSTELPQVSNYYQADETTESDHENSKRMRQASLEEYLLKIKKQNIEKRLKLEEAVKNSLKPQSKDVSNPFKVPARPVSAARRPAKTTQIKQKKDQMNLPFDDLPPEVLEDMKYKPPKRFQPSNASWITKRLYKYLETKLEPRYDYKARVRAEKLVESLYHFAKELRRHRVAPTDAVEVVKHEMARLEIVKTHFEFYEFFHEFMPKEVRIKVVPDVANKIPLPRHGLYTDIIRGNTVQG